MNRSVFAAGMVLTSIICPPLAGAMPENEPPEAHSEAACIRGIAPDAYALPAVKKSAETVGFERLITELSGKRVVFVGESHDRYEHHLNQLEIICRLYRRDPSLVIGMEFFQQPFQGALDNYTSGHLGVPEMLRRTEYYTRWRFDFRLYEPILRFAQENNIPLVALNVPAELIGRITRSGIAGLDEAARAQLPDIDRSDSDYRRRLEAVFDQHPGSEDAPFEHFLEAQLTWDEGMAESAARYLKENPGRTMVALAGSGHVAHRSGIPRRLARRIDVDIATVLQATDDVSEPESADFILLSDALELPAAGKLGVVLDTDDDGVAVRSFVERSAAEAAGVRAADRIVALDGAQIDGFADVKIALWDKRPGDKVFLRVARDQATAGPGDLALEVVLR